MIGQSCPGCGGERFSGEFFLKRQPVVLNYRFVDAASAQRVPRRDLFLRQCRRCGLIFNSKFSADVVPYDGNYENRQCFSPSFADYLQRLADDLANRYPLKPRGVLEVGCGKGDFLRLLC